MHIFLECLFSLPTAFFRHILFHALAEVTETSKGVEIPTKHCRKKRDRVKEVAAA